MRFTLSVSSFHTPPTSIVTAAAWPSLPSVPTSRATRVSSETNPLSWSTMALMVFFNSSISPLDVGRHLLAEVPVGHGTDHALHLDGGPHQRLDEIVHRLDASGPSSDSHPEVPTR